MDAIKNMKESLLYVDETQDKILVKARHQIAEKLNAKDFKLFNYCNYW